MCGVGIGISEWALAEAVTGPENLEKVEFQVPKVALVMPHGRPTPLPQFTSRISWYSRPPGEVTRQ